MNRKDIIKLLTRENLIQPRLLLVEDCKFDTVLIKKAIEDFSPFTLIDTAQTRHEAHKMLKANSYDIMLLDLHLPDSNGIHDIHEYKLISKETNLIVITGNATQEVASKSKLNGADGIIGKETLIQNNIDDAVLHFDAAISNAIMNIKKAANY